MCIKIGVNVYKNKAARRVVAHFLEAANKEGIWIEPRKTERLRDRPGVQERHKKVMTKPPKGEKGKKKPFGYPGEMVEELTEEGKKKPWYPQKVKNNG